MLTITSYLQRRS